MITIKDAAAFDKMRHAGKTVAGVLIALEEAAAPGVSMLELDELAADMIKSADCTPSFLGYHGYPATICTSPNNVIVHGIPDDTVLKQGDLLSVDVGAIFEGYHADAARTLPIGEVPEESQRLVRITEEAMTAGIAEVEAGARVGDISAAVQEVAEGGGFSVVREYVGHGIGEQMHEEPQIPNFGESGKGLRLKVGMAVCIEPMVNIGDWRTEQLEDGWTVVTADGSLSAHFENTVAITENGPEVLTI